MQLFDLPPLTPFRARLFYFFPLESIVVCRQKQASAPCTAALSSDTVPPPAPAVASELSRLQAYCVMFDESCHSLTHSLSQSVMATRADRPTRHVASSALFFLNFIFLERGEGQRTQLSRCVAPNKTQSDLMLLGILGRPFLAGQEFQVAWRMKDVRCQVHLNHVFQGKKDKCPSGRSTSMLPACVFSLFGSNTIGAAENPKESGATILVLLSVPNLGGGGWLWRASTGTPSVSRLFIVFSGDPVDSYCATQRIHSLCLQGLVFVLGRKKKTKSIIWILTLTGRFIKHTLLLLAA